MLRVTGVECLTDFWLRVAFHDGSVREVDLKNEIWGDIFAPLANPDFFKLVALNPETGTVEWPNGADIAPEYLHSFGIEVRGPR